jgi:hypothetical protein
VKVFHNWEKSDYAYFSYKGQVYCVWAKDNSPERAFVTEKSLAPSTEGRKPREVKPKAEEVKENGSKKAAAPKAAPKEKKDNGKKAAEKKVTPNFKKEAQPKIIRSADVEAADA